MLDQLHKSFQGQSSSCNCRRNKFKNSKQRQTNISTFPWMECWDRVGINLDVNWKTIQSPKYNNQPTNQQPSLSPKLIYKKQNGTMLTHIIKLCHLAQENQKLSDYPIARNSGSHGKPIWLSNSTYYNSMLHELYKVLKWSSRTLPFKLHWMQPVELQHMCRFPHYMNTYI